MLTWILINLFTVEIFIEFPSYSLTLVKERYCFTLNFSLFVWWFLGEFSSLKMESRISPRTTWNWILILDKLSTEVVQTSQLRFYNVAILILELDNFLSFTIFYHEWNYLLRMYKVKKGDNAMFNESALIVGCGLLLNVGLYVCLSSENYFRFNTDSQLKTHRS